MLGRVVLKRGGKGEAEKPFWISYSDLMTAMMMLFLVTMSATLLAVTKDLGEALDAGKLREGEILELWSELKTAAQEHGGIGVDCVSKRIDFGDRARFEKNQYRLAPSSARALREFVPEILAISASPSGKKWLHRVVIEGFTDTDGTYLYNLDLSLKRAQTVLCALFASPEPEEKPLAVEDLLRIRRLFLVGGFSYNTAKSTKEESRRVELRLEFLGLEDFQEGAALVAPSIEETPLGECQVEKHP